MDLSQHRKKNPLTLFTFIRYTALVVVGSESAQDTFSFVLDKTVRYFNKAGREIDGHLIKPGTHIHFYYDGTGKTHAVTGVVVDEN